MAYIYDLADTWNASGTTFTGIKLNVTDTASASTSLLMDLQVGGSSKFKVSKDGWVYPAAGNYTGGGVRFPTANVYITEYQAGLWLRGGTATGAGGDSAQMFILDNAVRLATSVRLEWASASYPNGATDLALARDAANTLAQRNGVNAQAFNLYNTYTDASNYERGFMRFVSNALEIGMEAAGTGSNRFIKLIAGGLSRMDVTSSGVFINTAIYGSTAGIDIGSTNYPFRHLTQTNGYHQMSEMTAPAAPATNNVRIYAEDDGAGKTRLMARFATGAAVQIAIEP